MPLGLRMALRASALFLFPIWFVTASLADGPDLGWHSEGAYGTPYMAYRAGIGHTEVNRPRRDALTGEAPSGSNTDWNGFYAGVTAAGAVGEAEFKHGTIDSDGSAVGAHLGYNWQMGDAVAGLEFDYAMVNADGTRGLGGGIAARAAIDDLSSARLRAGYAFGGHLLYGTAGLALSSTDVTLSGPAFQTRESALQSGYVIGAGAETELLAGVTARIEALHYGFAGEGLPGTGELGFEVTTIRAGFSLKFD